LPLIARLAAGCRICSNRACTERPRRRALAALALDQALTAVAHRAYESVHAMRSAHFEGQLPNAGDMTRKRIELKASAGVDRSEVIDRLDDKMEAIDVRSSFKAAIAGEGCSGREHPFATRQGTGFGPRLTQG
jgi:hypothetical protein